MISFPGFDNIACTGETPEYRMYDATEIQTGEPALIKVIDAPGPSVYENARFLHEYGIIRDARIDGVNRILDIGQIASEDGAPPCLALAEAAFRGKSLKEIAHQNHPRAMPVEDFHEIAVRMAEIVENIHRHNLAHRNLTPGTIYREEASGRLLVTDFGILSEASGARNRIHDAWVIENILPYISPEQTGRINRSVDMRTDLYSLGAILYELITGAPPFFFSDPMEIIYSHIARTPSPLAPVDDTVSTAQAEIIAKLLAKNPEERYQTGLGLKNDLLEWIKRERQGRKTDTFLLGSRDIRLRFTMPRILAGRSHETRMLKNAFERVASGKMEAVFVSGEHGIGKTSLIRDLGQTVAGRRGFFLAGKYDQMEKNVPYSAFSRAFETMVGQILASDEETIHRWAEKIQDAVGENGKIITDILPGMRRVIGSQPDLQTLDPEGLKNLLTKVARKVISALADKEHPVVLFLDDLQWADPASIDLIENITAYGGIRYLLFIGAWRNDGTNPNRDIRQTMAIIEQAGIRLAHLSLSPLDENAISEILAEWLRLPAPDCRPLAAVIHEKTLGNPLFVNQFIKTLYEEKLLEMEPSGKWRFDFDAIRRIQATDNVFDFMAQKLAQLPPRERDIIAVCACIGSDLDMETLLAAVNQSAGRILSVLDRLVADGYLTFRQKTYYFTHDRILESAYRLMPADKRTEIHYRMGKWAGEAHLSSEKPIKPIFFAADQLNLGQALMRGEEKRRLLTRINLEAGRRARDAAAFSAATNYFQAGIDALPDDAWKSEYKTAFGLYLHQMECRYITQDFGEAGRLFGIISDNARTPADKANACSIMVIQYTHQRFYREALELGTQALERYGIRATTDIGAFRVLTELLRVKWLLRKTPIDSIPHLDVLKDSEMLAHANLLLAMGTPAFYTNEKLFAFIVLRGAREALQTGLTPHSSSTFIALAAIIQNTLGDYETGYRMGKMAIELNERLGNRRLAGQVHHTFAFFIQHWTMHARHDLDVYRGVYRMSLDAGNLIFAGHGVNAAIDCRLMIGDPLDDILEESKQYEKLMNHINDPFISARFSENRQFARCLMGRTSDPLSLSGDGFDENAYFEMLLAENNIFGLCFALLYKLMVFYHHGRYEKARQTARTLDRHIEVPVGTLLLPLHFFYSSLALAEIARTKQGRQKRRILADIRKRQRRMKKWARLCPENFAHKHDLVEAAVVEISPDSRRGRFDQALKLYHEAIRGARQHGYTQEEAVACAKLGRFYLDRDVREEAALYLKKSHECFGRIKARALQEALEEQHPDVLRNAASKRETDAFPEEPFSPAAYAGSLDMETVMKVSRAISSEIVLDRLVEKVMDLSVTNAGAQKGFLVLKNDTGLAVEAGHDPDARPGRIERPVPLESCPGLSHAIVSYVFRSQEPVILADASREGPFQNDRHVRSNNCKSVLCMPLMNKGLATGVLYMENNLGTNVFTEKQIELLNIITAQAAVSLENARLFDMATTDGLTRLYVYRYFQLLLEQEMQRAKRYGHSCSLLMIDIDNFKYFNDTYGHPLGDEVLKAIAETLVENTRTVDIVARYGGEEFAIILPETGAGDAPEVGEKIREAIAGIQLSKDEKTLYVTASIGTATFPDHAADKAQLICRADKALYDSKRNGKNRVTVSSIPLVHSEG